MTMPSSVVQYSVNGHSDAQEAKWVEHCKTDHPNTPDLSEIAMPTQAQLYARLLRDRWENDSKFNTPAMLVYGPSGTGKTVFAKALAKDLAMTLYLVTPADVCYESIDVSERFLRALFNDAKRQKRAMILIPDIDVVFDGSDQSAVGQLKTLMSASYEESARILVLGTTYNPLDVLKEQEFARRFVWRVFFDTPSPPQRRTLLLHLMKDREICHELTDADLTELTTAMPALMTGADIGNILDEVLRKSLLALYSATHFRQITFQGSQRYFACEANDPGASELSTTNTDSLKLEPAIITKGALLGPIRNCRTILNVKTCEEYRRHHASLQTPPDADSSNKRKRGDEI